MERLAVEGGTPVRRATLPYGRQSVDEDDVEAVVEVLRSDWLTTGPGVAAFEAAVAAEAGAAHGVAVSSGTAALHAAMHALGLGPGDEVVVPPITFAATANAARYCGARPVFADVEPGTLLLDPAAAEAAVTPRTRAIVGVDYAGQPCDWDALRDLADPRGLALVADGCHALGAALRGRPVGSLADLTVFSFHPVKHVTTGEGGMVVTDNAGLAARMRSFRNHGITTDHRQRAEQGLHHYEMRELGYNFRLTDLQCALGASQLRKLPRFLAARRATAARYGEALAKLPGVAPLDVRPGAAHAYHLYPVLLDPAAWTVDRDQVFRALRAEGIGCAVHYIPVHLHPYYRALGHGPGEAPVAEAAYPRLLSLPIFPAMTPSDVEDVVAALQKVAARYAA